MRPFFLSHLVSSARGEDRALTTSPSLLLCRSSALWVDIHSGWYDFEQRWRDAETVKKLTKADLVSFFSTYFFDSADRPLHRLSIHLDSQRLTPEALGTLGPALDKLGVEADPAQMAALAKSRPTVDAAKVAAEQLLRAKGRSDDDVKQLLDEVEKLRTLEVPQGYELIGDREQWRSRLEKAPHAHPIAEVRPFLSLSLSLSLSLVVSCR